jgi:hypothetical protein
LDGSIYPLRVVLGLDHYVGIDSRIIKVRLPQKSAQRSRYNTPVPMVRQSTNASTSNKLGGFAGCHTTPGCHWLG